MMKEISKIELRSMAMEEAVRSFEIGCYGAPGNDEEVVKESADAIMDNVMRSMKLPISELGLMENTSESTSPISDDDDYNREFETKLRDIALNQIKLENHISITDDSSTDNGSLPSTIVALVKNKK